MRNKEHAQYMVGIPRDSEMHRFYLEEAKSQGVKLPTFIYQLLQDRYLALQWQGQGVWFPRGQEQLFQEKPVSDGEVGTSPRLAVIAFGGEDDA